MKTNFKQILQNIVSNLSLAGFSLWVFNTVNNLTTMNSLRESLEFERNKNTKLINDINKLSEDKIESFFNNNIEINNNKLEILNNKINKLVENKNIDDKSVSEVNETIKEINNDLIEIINKIDESSTKFNFIGEDFFKLFSEMNNYFAKLNVLQNIALTHIFAIIFIFLSLVSLVSIYLGDYLIEKYFNNEKYPRIYKFLMLRRKFQMFYLIKDLTVVLIILIIIFKHYVTYKLYFIRFSLSSNRIYILLDLNQ